MPVSRSERDFLNLSEALTGFDRVELEGTGISTVYYQTVRQIVGGLIFGRLLLTWRELADHVLPALHTEAEREAAIRQKFFNDPRLGAMLGPIVQNIITLWYIGNWNQLPRVWRNRWGANAQDLTHVVSAEAYQEGLIWRAILAHPPTAKSPGFGSWEFPVEGAEPLNKSDEGFLEARKLVGEALKTHARATPVQGAAATKGPATKRGKKS